MAANASRCGGYIFKRGKHVLTAVPLAGTVIASGILASGLLSLAPTPAHAVCNPSDTGTVANDIITCDATNAPAGLVQGLAGDDTITIDGVTAPLDVRGDDGADAITLINSATVSGNVEGGNDADVINLNDGTVAGNVLGGTGDDTVTFDFGASIGGMLDGGAGLDTLETRFNGTAATYTLPGSQVSGFEVLVKGSTGLNTLNLTGTHTFSGHIEIIATVVGVGAFFPGVITDPLAYTATPSIRMDQNALVLVGGTLDNGVGGDVVITQQGLPNSAQTIAVFDGGVLRAVGDLQGGPDWLEVAGTLHVGATGFDLGAGTDLLFIRENADVNGLIDGGTNVPGFLSDRVNADVGAGNTASFERVINFEILNKTGDGTLVVEGPGASNFDEINLTAGVLNADTSVGGTTINLGDGATLNVNDIVDNGAGGQAQLVGSSGANTINVNAGASLLASGDLGDGADTLTVSGTLNTGAGTLTLGLGDDTFTVSDGAMIIGTVDGGAGADTFITDISTTANLTGVITGFETLTKTGGGVLEVNGPGTSSFDTVNVNDGTLDIGAGGGITGVSMATVLGGATLNLAGAFTFTPGDDTFDLAGILTGANDIDMLGGDDTMTLRSTADISGFTGIFDGGGHGTGDTFTIDGWSGTLLGTRVQNWETVAVDNGANVNFGPSLGVGTGAGMGLIVGAGSTASGDTAFALTGDLTTAIGGLFTNHGGGAGNVTVSGNVTNNGTISMRDGAAGDTISVSGDYTGSGALRLDVDFTADTADTLTITGNVTPGPTTIFVADISTGAATGSDILVVDVTGTTMAGDFQLDGGSVQVGSLTYGLNLVGTQWFLQSLLPMLLPQNLIYEAYPRNLQALNTMLTHRQRVQDRTWLAGGQAPFEDGGIWLRVSGGLSDFDPKSSTTEEDFGTSDIDHDITTAKFEAGLDVLLAANDTGRLVGGLRSSYGTASLSGSSPLISGDIDTNAIGLGASLTWYGNWGIYIDTQLQYAFFDSDLSVDTGTLASGNDGSGFAASLEVGRAFSLSETLSFTPELQYVHYRVDFDAFTAESGEAVFMEDGTTDELRLGATLEYQSPVSEGSNSRFYVTANAFHRFDGETSVNAASDSLTSDTRAWRGEIGVGGSYEWIGADGTRSAIHADIVAGSEFGSELESGANLSGRIGFKMEF